MKKSVIILPCLMVSFVCLAIVQSHKSRDRNTIYDLVQSSALEESIQRGSEVYEGFCMRCHLPSGEGVKGAFPPLAGSDYLLKNREASIKAVKYGQSGEIIVNGVAYNSIMSPMGLADEEVADVMNFILHSWGNHSDAKVTEEEVAKVKK